MARESKRKRDAARFGPPRTLLDRCLTETVIPAWCPAGFGAELRESLYHECRNAVVFKADNVFEHMAGAGQVFSADPARFHCVTPPYDRVWVETSQSGRASIDAPTGDGQRMALPEMIGGLLLTSDVDRLPVDSGRFRTRFPTAVKAGCFYTSMCYSFDFSGTPMFPAGNVTFGIERDGTLSGPCGYRPFGIENAIHDVDETTNLAVVDVLQVTTILLLETLCFLNLRNVSTVADPPDPAHVRERRKAGREPLVKFHTIRVNGLGRNRGRDRVEPGDRIPQSFHICRGHRKTYTEERPAFGKLTGTWWVPAHGRGDKNVGTVVKDYAVGPEPGDSDE